jgi:hypothetical protein
VLHRDRRRNSSLRSLKTELARLLDQAQSCPTDSWWCATEFTRKEVSKNETQPLSQLRLPMRTTSMPVLRLLNLAIRRV